MDIETTNATHNVWNSRIDNFRKFSYNSPKSLFSITAAENTLFWKDAWYTEQQVDILKSDPQFTTMYKDLLESRNDIPSEFLSEHYNTSGCNISHIYQLKLIIDTFGLNLSEYNNVLEFGSGYGNLCKLFYNSGYTNKYHISELGPVIDFTKKYLKYNNIELSNINFKPKNNIDYDLFISFWALSETLFSFRTNILEGTNYKRVIIGYQSQFRELDNFTYFDEFIKRYNNYDWTVQEWFGKKNYILFGVRKNGLDDDLLHKQQLEAELKAEAEAEAEAEKQRERLRLLDVEAERLRLLDVEAERLRLLEVEAERLRLLDVEAERLRLLDVEAKRHQEEELREKRERDRQEVIARRQREREESAKRQQHANELVLDFGDKNIDNIGSDLDGLDLVIDE